MTSPTPSGQPGSPGPSTSDPGLLTPVRVARSSLDLTTSLEGQDKENSKRLFTLYYSLREVLEEHRRNREFLFFFVDEWQTAGLQAHEVMWGIGPRGLTIDNIREVPSLSGRYRYPLWPQQVMLRVTDTAPFTWRRASLKNIAQTVREAQLMRDLLACEFSALIHAPLTMQDEVMAVVDGQAAGDGGAPDAPGGSAMVVEPAVAALDAPPSVAGGSVDEPTPSTSRTGVEPIISSKPADVLESRLQVPAGGDGSFRFPYQIMSVGSQPLVVRSNVFISTAKFKAIRSQYKHNPEEYLKAIIKELLGTDTEATKAYIGSLRGKKGITNTVTADFLPALKGFFPPKQFPSLYPNKVSWWASKMVDRLRND